MEIYPCDKEMYDYIMTEIIPECNKKLRKYKEDCGHSSIYGDEVVIKGTGKWVNIIGTRPGIKYTYLRIRKCDEKIYSASGKVGMCHYRDKECWSKKRMYFVQEDKN